MTHLQPTAAFLHLATPENGRRIFLCLILSGLAVLGAAIAPHPVVRPLLMGAGAGLLSVSLMKGTQAAAVRLGRLVRRPAVVRRLMDHPHPAFLTDRWLAYLDRNSAAEGFAHLTPGAPLAGIFVGHFAAPEDVLRALAAAALAGGSPTRRVGEDDLTVTVAEGGSLLWSLAPREALQAPPAKVAEPAILTVSAEGRILDMNAGASALLGGRPERLSDLVADLPLRADGRHRLRLAEGEAAATLFEVPGDKGTRRIVVVPDARAAEVERPAALGSPGVVDLLPVPMLKIAVDGTLLEANTQARALFELDPGPLPPLFELVEGMGRPIADWLAAAAEGRGLLKPEIVRAVVPGKELFLQIALGRAVEDGEVTLVGLLNDATELKTLEAQFVQSQKMQAIGQLAGGVAHDFNNLLTAIGGHCDLLLLRHDPGDPDYADLIQISQNANRAAALVGQLLAFSRKQNLKPQALDLRDTMSDLAHLLNRLIGERIRLDVKHGPGPQDIRADRRQLEQVIVNLVVNARDAMPDGGTVTIETHSEVLKDDVTRDRARVPAGDYVVIEVRDTGIGIAPDGLSKIFEPFYTTKKTGEGTGLGLSTAYGIVKQTGGYIFVDSETGRGTVFSLYFPANSAPMDPVAPVVSQPARVPAGRGDGVILLVEDEAPVRAFASRALRMRGYTVVEAENAEVALKILEDDGFRVDVFVTDVIMPGMDGPTWVRQALKKRPDTCVVFMSGYAEEGRTEKQARIPNSVFLPKPFSLQQLTALVQEQLS